ncbi:MAG: acylglycerol lipase [Saprospiraceae bacterium]|jgi:acylglycerol lipase
MTETKMLRVDDKYQLHIVSHTIDNPKANLVLVHGYAEHSARYEHFFKEANLKGINVYSFDKRGHGKSEGLKAYLPNLDDLVLDIGRVIDHFDLRKKTFLMGHSLGGLLATRYCLTQDQANVQGLITSAAALEIDKDLSPLLQALAPILGKILPKMKTEKLDTTYLTRSKEVKEAYFADPLVYNEGTRARTGAEMLKGIKNTPALFAKLTIPLLAMHGSADGLTMPDGTIRFYKEASSTDKTLKIYDGFYHELVNEPEKASVINDILTWILKRA